MGRTKSVPNEKYPGAAAVIVMNAPLPGAVKTRLCPPLNALQASELAAAMAWDVCRSVRSVFSHVYVAYHLAPQYELSGTIDGRKIVKSVLFTQGAGIKYIKQRGNSPGRRIDDAIGELAAMGYAPIVAVGIDEPTLSEADLHAGMEPLISTHRPADVVLSPTDRGGYRLIGLRAPVTGLFNDVRWGSEHALGDTCARARSLHLRLGMTAGSYDIDDFGDLQRLASDFETDEALQALRERSRTYAWISNHRSLFAPDATHAEAQDAGIPLIVAADAPKQPG